jgi:hypothetical protein
VALALAATVGVTLALKDSAGVVRAIDLEGGSFRGVTVGDREREVRRALGEPKQVASGGPITPAGDDFVDIGGPTLVQSPGRPLVLRYNGVAVLLSEDEVFGIVITDGDARTGRGVEIGDDLSLARRTYDLRCGEATAGEAVFGRSPTYSFCVGRLASDRWIWFGRDPIRSIVVTTTRMSG